MPADLFAKMCCQPVVGFRSICLDLLPACCLILRRKISLIMWFQEPLKLRQEITCMLRESFPRSTVPDQFCIAEAGQYPGEKF